MNELQVDVLDGIAGKIASLQVQQVVSADILRGIENDE
jgi:hypothetical protein